VEIKLWVDESNDVAGELPKIYKEINFKGKVDKYSVY
jgi:hypothetical protein